MPVRTLRKILLLLAVSLFTALILTSCSYTVIEDREETVVLP